MRHAQKQPGLRIAYVMSQFPVPTQTFACSDIEALLADGHSVSVFAMKPRPARHVPGICTSHASLRGAMIWPRALWRMRSAVVRLASAVLRFSGNSARDAVIALACLPRAAEIADRIEQGAFDVVHLFWARQAALVLALLEMRDWPGKRSTFVGAYDLVADDFLVELALGSADLVFTHCAANSAYVSAKTPKDVPVAIVHRGIPLLTHDSKAERDPDVWVTASALVKDKNVEGVLVAFAKAREQNARLHLRIFGSGPERKRLEELARAFGIFETTSFEGHRSREEVFASMQRADTFVLLSQKPSERLPNVIKEALWAGCRVISSNSIGIEELLPHEGIGLVVDPTDQRQVSQAVHAVLHRDRTRDEEWRQAAQAWIAERFSATANMREYARHWAGTANSDAADVRSASSRIADPEPTLHGIGR